MIGKEILKRGSKLYGTGVNGAHKFVSAGLRTPLKVGMIATKGLPILPKGLRIVDRTVGAGLNTGFGFIGAAPRIARRGGALLLSPLHQVHSSVSLKHKKSLKRKRSKRKSPKQKSPKRKRK